MICSSSGEKNKKDCEKELVCCDLAISYPQMRHICTVQSLLVVVILPLTIMTAAFVGASLGISPYIN